MFESLTENTNNRPANNSGSSSQRVWKGIFLRDSKFGRNTVRDSGKRKNSWRDTRFDRYSRGGIRRNLGTGWGIGKESGIRGRDFRSSGCGIVVKKMREYGIRDPLPLLACEQALLFVSLARSREARPNRRACSQAIPLSDPKVNVPLIKWYVSGKLPTYSSPKPTFCPKWEVSVDVCLGRGRWAVSQKRIMIQ